MYAGPDGTWSNDKASPKNQATSNNQTEKVGMMKKVNGTIVSLGSTNSTKISDLGHRLMKALQKAVQRAQRIRQEFREEQKLIQEEFEEAKSLAINMAHVVSTMGMYLLYLFHLN